MVIRLRFVTAALPWLNLTFSLSLRGIVGSTKFTEFKLKIFQAGQCGIASHSGDALEESVCFVDTTAP
jgi:hypothetical protein